jgi:hypothetical protein
MAWDKRHFPIVLVEDRYSGTYSGGEWLAVSQANKVHKSHARLGPSRLRFLLTTGPYGEPETASTFWRRPPIWVASGDDPLVALDHVRSQNDHERYGVYPIAIVENPYFGEHGGDLWFAVAKCTRSPDVDIPYPVGDSLRIELVLSDGPGAGDVEAVGFWAMPPPWIAVGALPAQALDNLVAGIGPTPFPHRRGKSSL